MSVSHSFLFAILTSLILTIKVITLILSETMKI